MLTSSLGRSLLTAWMADRKMTQVSFAALVPCASASISNLLAGKRGCGLALAVAIEQTTKSAVPAESWGQALPPPKVAIRRKKVAKPTRRVVAARARA